MYSLFFDPTLTVEQFKRIYDINISEEFVSCADQQLTPIFELTAGLKFNKNLCISWVPKENFNYEKGPTSKLSFYLYVNNNWNPIYINWKSKSGRIYSIDDKSIDCDDIVFSFEHLDVQLYQKQLYPNDKFPFKIKDLSFDVVIHRLNIDCLIKLYVRPDAKIDKQIIKTKIIDFIANYNTTSEKAGRKNGVVHNYDISIKDDIIECQIDLGSAGFYFCKKFLMMLSKLECFTKAEFE